MTRAFRVRTDARCRALLPSLRRAKAKQRLLAQVVPERERVSVPNRPSRAERLKAMRQSLRLCNSRLAALGETESDTSARPSLLCASVLSVSCARRSNAPVERAEGDE